MTAGGAKPACLFCMIFPIFYNPVLGEMPLSPKNGKKKHRKCDQRAVVNRVSASRRKAKAARLARRKNRRK